MKPSVVRNFFLGTLLFSIPTIAIWLVLVRKYPLINQLNPNLQESFQMWVVTPEGEVVGSSNSSSLPFSWSELDAPSPGEKLRFKPGSTMGKFTAIFRTQGKQEGYVVFHREAPSAFFALYRWGPYILPLLIGILLTVAFVLARYSQSKRNIAREVMGEFTRGNLKARFSIDKMDEVGEVMATFNKMANEIEGLVSKLKAMEKARTDLLRSLAHDLRTPLTSIELRVEEVAEIGHKLSKTEIRRKMRVATEEMVYFKRLLGDIFMISNLEDPLFVPQTVPVDLRGSIALELEQVERNSKLHGKKLKFEMHVDSKAVTSLQADPFLMKRLLRNGLENAGQYARKRVAVSVGSTANFLEIIIADDGAGFSEETLKSFGVRHHSRFLDSQTSQKVSLGLGSLIMKRIAHHYQGEVQAANWLLPSGKVGGGRVLIRLALPRAKSLPQAA